MKNKNHELTAVLSYLGILVLIPFFVIEKKKRDDFIKFHLKQGFVLLIMEIILSVVMNVFGWIPVLGAVISGLLGLVFVAIVIIIIIAIIKALQGEKWKIPVVSDYTHLIKI
jgi:uncharacterized membrane protein